LHLFEKQNKKRNQCKKFLIKFFNIQQTIKSEGRLYMLYTISIKLTTTSQLKKTKKTKKTEI